MAAAATAARPTFIAGGLAPGNVAQCVQMTRPLAVDASSGMEKVKGVKDPELVPPPEPQPRDSTTSATPHAREENMMMKMMLMMLPLSSEFGT